MPTSPVQLKPFKATRAKEEAAKFESVTERLGRWADTVLDIIPSHRRRTTARWITEVEREMMAGNTKITGSGLSDLVERFEWFSQHPAPRLHGREINEYPQSFAFRIEGLDDDTAVQFFASVVGPYARAVLEANKESFSPSLKRDRWEVLLAEFEKISERPAIAAAMSRDAELIFAIRSDNSEFRFDSRDRLIRKLAVDGPAEGNFARTSPAFLAGIPEFALQSKSLRVGLQTVAHAQAFDLEDIPNSLDSPGPQLVPVYTAVDAAVARAAEVVTVGISGADENGNEVRVPIKTIEAAARVMARFPKHSRERLGRDRRTVVFKSLINFAAATKVTSKKERSAADAAIKAVVGLTVADPSGADTEWLAENLDFLRTARPDFTRNIARAVSPHVGQPNGDLLIPVAKPFDSGVIPTTDVAL